MGWARRQLRERTRDSNSAMVQDDVYISGDRSESLRISNSDLDEARRRDQLLRAFEP